ncbi:hypothetical protein [Flavobacterium sharifuzzamanii]|uniref:hypothetical protein n=1 Tax=Flavobacterium sharifuzzamanii TaxID=2211133 RepID=UPI000DAEC036|nr:hypothetical protein [Flavobacterium sharifuzzamanii]KAF2081796.1 hypothetical protein DMA14_08335 [Flavobacterium sharifuzzamanii]
MKKLLSISLLLVLIFTTGCGSDVLCSTGPATITVEFVDKDSGENLFENGTFDSKKEVTITDLDQNKVIESAYVNSDNLNRLTFSLGWESKSLKYAITIEGKNVCEIYAVTEKRTGGECSSVVIKSVEIKNAELKKDNTTWVYKILINTKD